ncbi:hypothetical protein DFH08DRAFT_892066, partial [Mycena albidolilacea]
MKTAAAHRKKHAAGIHSLHTIRLRHLGPSYSLRNFSACTDRIRRTSARARKPFPYHITDRTSGSSSAHPPLQATPSRKTTRRATTHAHFALAVHDAGQRGAGTSKPPFTTRPLCMLPTVCVTVDSFLRWDSRSTCILSSRDTPMKASRTARVCVSASCGHLIDLFIDGAGRGREGEASD